MRPLIIVLSALLFVLQYELWFVPNGLAEVWKLHQSVAAMKASNDELLQKNEQLAADVADLKNGNEAVEERARNELGMVKQGEIFYQMVGKSAK